MVSLFMSVINKCVNELKNRTTIWFKRCSISFKEGKAKVRGTFEVLIGKNISVPF